jgi:hypothetical protein
VSVPGGEPVETALYPAAGSDVSPKANPLSKTKSLICCQHTDWRNSASYLASLYNTRDRNATTNGTRAGPQPYLRMLKVTANRFRPRTRRRFSVLRPPGVCMRLRKPCLRRRRRTFGCQVRFTICSLLLISVPPIIPYQAYIIRASRSPCQIGDWRLPNQNTDGSSPATSPFPMLLALHSRVWRRPSVSAVIRTPLADAGDVCVAIWIRQRHHDLG